MNRVDKSFGVFDFGIEVAGEVGVLGEGVEVEVPEDILGLFEHLVVVVEGEMQYNK